MSPLTLQTITIALMLSVARGRGRTISNVTLGDLYDMSLIYLSLHQTLQSLKDYGSTFSFYIFTLHLYKKTQSKVK